MKGQKVSFLNKAKPDQFIDSRADRSPIQLHTKSSTPLYINTYTLLFSKQLIFSYCSSNTDNFYKANSTVEFIYVQYLAISSTPRYS